MGKKKVGPPNLMAPGKDFYNRCLRVFSDADRKPSIVEQSCIEMLASVYDEFRDPELELKEKHDAIKLFIKLSKDFGPSLDLKTSDADTEKDLEEVLNG